MELIISLEPVVREGGVFVLLLYCCAPVCDAMPLKDPAAFFFLCYFVSLNAPGKIESKVRTVREVC